MKCSEMEMGEGEVSEFLRSAAVAVSEMEGEESGWLESEHEEGVLARKYGRGTTGIIFQNASGSYEVGICFDSMEDAMGWVDTLLRLATEGGSHE